MVQKINLAGDYMKQRIGVLGGGSWGTALAVLLANKDMDVDMWLRDEVQLSNMISSRENKKYLPNIKLPLNLNLINDIEKHIYNKDIIQITL